MEVIVYHLPDRLDPPLPPALLVDYRPLSLGSVTSSVLRQEGSYYQDNKNNIEDTLQVCHT